jgi:hypothetical protein
MKIISNSNDFENKNSNGFENKNSNDFENKNLKRFSSLVICFAIIFTKIVQQKKIIFSFNITSTYDLKCNIIINYMNFSKIFGL